MEKELKFIKEHPDHPNEVLYLGENAFVSYNPGRHLLGLAMFAGDNFRDETTLVLIHGDPQKPKRGDRKFYILNGDFRQEYIDAFKTGGIEGCCKLFAERQEKFGSTWTTNSDPMKLFQGMMERIIEKHESNDKSGINDEG